MSEPLAAADRASLFSWLSSVFLREPDAAVVAAVCGPQGEAAGAALAPWPALAAEADAMRRAALAVRAAEQSDRNAAITLAGRYGTLFLGAGGPNAAHPYASIYLEERTHGAATDRAAAFLAEHELSVAPGTSEPADHVGILFAGLAELAAREAEAEDAAAPALRTTQETFVQAEILPWFADFRARVERDDAGGYYAAATRLADAALRAAYHPASAG